MALINIGYYFVLLLYHSFHGAWSSPRCSNNKAERYQLFDGFLDSKSWPDARLHCQGLGRADLVSIDNDEEMSYVRNLLSMSIIESYWVGLGDAEEDGVFRWINAAEDIEYSPGWLWHKNEPTNNFPLIWEEDCGLMTKDNLYNVHGLADYDCSLSYYYICEDDNNPCTADQFFTAESCDITDRYGVYLTYLTWEQARDACILEGWELASLSSEAEVRFIRLGLLLFDPPFDDGDYWVGLRDKHNEGTWEWVGHDEFGVEADVPSYGRWNPQEPNGGPGENCVELKQPIDIALPRGYNDVGCHFSKSFICEFSSCQEEQFAIQSGYRLKNHLLYSVEVQKLSRCTKACLRDHNCRSVNLIPIENETNKYRCEISETTKEESLSSDYTILSGGFYAGIV